jgi:hypothetical protein
MAIEMHMRKIKHIQIQTVVDGKDLCHAECPKAPHQPSFELRYMNQKEVEFLSNFYSPHKNLELAIKCRNTRLSIKVCLRFY